MDAVVRMEHHGGPYGGVSGVVTCPICCAELRFGSFYEDVAEKGALQMLWEHAGHKHRSDPVAAKG